MASFNDKEPSSPPQVPASANAFACEDSSMASEQLVDLPVEMQLRILSHLPAKDIQRFRRVKRHFREMIDLKENQALLIGPGIAQSMHRFNTFIKRYCEFPMASEDGGPDAFLDAIFDFISLRKLDYELWTDWEDGLDEFNAFWLARRNREPTVADEAVTFTDDFCEMWECALNSAGIMPAHNIFAEIYGFKPKTMLTRIIAFIHNRDANGWWLAEALETGIPAQKTNSQSETLQMCEDEMEVLHRVLEVPMLPGKSSFVYYSNSMWPLERLQAAMVSSEKIGGVERAALMEELYIR